MDLLPTLLMIAWLLPLASFAMIVLFGPRMGKAGEMASYVATLSIVGSAVLSILSLVIWIGANGIFTADHGDGHGAAAHAAADAHGEAAHAETSHGEEAHAAASITALTGEWYAIGQFGSIRPAIGYYIDSLTVVMFTMVTIIASCIHFYAYGYMHDELHEVVDHDVTTSDGHHLHRPGRFHRFFQFLSLFCFSMLGIVIAGNVLMVFVFWELVGICSYFLIGFYRERKSASNAANKAFIVNRVGDFGMLIGMSILISTLGTLSFGDLQTADGVQPGLFSLARPAETGHALQTPDGMVIESAWREIESGVEPTGLQIERWRNEGYGYWLLVFAGLGIFCGCVGKSAQFPLHTWLPDAMEGPTPVSALVHSATMVAAGVYLVGRFYPVFAPEVLLVIACIGAITLFIAATIAITAVDIKRVLAYSTISQLGYMMLALGLGGWVAGLFHLITHAFFKSLLFMCSGSVIHAVHTNDMTKMGGLRHKMPWTAYTMLVGCLAIIGAPFFSGFYSKDAIIAQALLFWRGHGEYAGNPEQGILFLAAAAGGAAITAFYMFRLWFLTFAGEPRDKHIYEHVHESPKVMYVPLVVLAVFAVVIGWPVFGVTAMLEQSRPLGAIGDGVLLGNLAYGDEHLSHEPDIHWAATGLASATALAGFLLAVVFYGKRLLNPDEARAQFARVHNFLVNKWWFDEIYDVLFVRPVRLFSGVVSRFDRGVIDRIIDGAARGVVAIARVDDAIDRNVVDRIANMIGDWTWSAGQSARTVQTGRLRQYVMFIVVGLVALAAIVNMAIAN